MNSNSDVRPSSPRLGGSKVAASRVPVLLHIEDDPMWGDAVRQIMRSWRDVRYAGQAFTGKQGLTLAKKTKPDVVLLDLVLPDTDGFELMEKLLRLPNAPRIVLLTCRADAAAIYRFAQGDVAGVVWKNVSVAQKLRTVFSAVLDGRTFFPSDVLDAMKRLRQEPAALPKILSKRELELLPKLGQGESDAEIAGTTAVRAATVKSHRYHIMTKLGLGSTRELMRWAVEKGFSKPSTRAPFSAR